MSPRCPLLLALLAGCAPTGDWTIKPGVEMVTVTGAEPDEPLTLYDGRTALLTVLADDMGQAHFAYVPESPITLDSGAGMVLPVENGAVVEPGRYRIRNDEAGTASAPFEVLSIDDLPDPSLYESQRVEGVYTSLLGEAGTDAADGFHYIEMRDGVLLSVLVRYPDPTLYGYGPYPTVVEYSGYSPSRPDRNSSGQQIANAMGYATVGVNMRGTGCSGGVFDVFNPAQHADGYDIIETVARQPWVLDGRVGMVGLSYPGISQLYVASTNPPSLAGVVPLSVIADAWEMQWPGGIYNSGFTRQWVGNRDSDASVGGSDWVTKRIEGGDAVCEENVRLSNQNIDFESFLRALEYRPIHADPRDLNLLVEQIEAPVFLGGAFQDEQTGALFAGMLDRFDASEGARFTIANGRHPDGYAPEMAYRWFEFLEFYVARRIPRLNAAVRLGAAPEFGSVYGMTDVAFEDDRFDDFGDDYAAALAAYEAEPRVRVLFEVGAEGSPTGAPESRFEARSRPGPARRPKRSRGTSMQTGSWLMSRAQWEPMSGPSMPRPVARPSSARLATRSWPRSGTSTGRTSPRARSSHTRRRPSRKTRFWPGPVSRSSGFEARRRTSPCR